jgi:hypothetical protein
MTNLLEVVGAILAQPVSGGGRSGGPDYRRCRGSLQERLDSV